MKELTGSRLFVIAIVCGLIAAGLTVFYMQEIESKYRKASQPKKEVMVALVVPRKNMAKGDRLLEESMASRNVPEKYLPANAVLAKDFKKIVNRTLLLPIQLGRPMTWEAVTGTAAETFSEVIELGRRAKTIKVNSVDSFDGLLRPGDIIDLMGTFTLSNLGIASTTSSTMSEDIVMPVLEKVEVIEASRQDLSGRRYEIKRNKNSTDGFNMDFSLITLNLSPKQVARIELAERTGDVFAVLRHPKDTSLTDYEYLGVELLLDKDSPEPVDLVLDENGNPIGRIIGDNVVDKDGNIVGKVVDGKAVSFDGKTLGKVVKNVSADDPINRVAEVADLVRDANGNVVGKIVNGKIVDKAGNVIGEVKDGKAISLSGQSLGAIERGVSLDKAGNVVDTSSSGVAAVQTRREQVVRDGNGNVVGRIVNGEVLDASGKVIGRVDKNGRAIGLDGRNLGQTEEVLVDRNGKIIGQQAKVVRDASGKFIGRVVDGNVLDANGNIIGIVAADGSVKALGDSMGTVETAEVVRDASGNVIGMVVDGKIIDADGNVIGTVGSDGAAYGLDGEILGVVESAEVVIDANGNLVGVVVDGKVLDASGTVIGVVGSDGIARRLGESLGVVETAMLDKNGEVLGAVTKVVRDADGNIVGRIVNGKVVDADGNVIGTVDRNGNAVGLDGKVLGKIETLVLGKDGRPVDKALEVIRDAQGNIIGTLVDGKVIGKDGKVVGELVNGQVIDANGNVLARNATVSSESALAVQVEMRNSEVTGITRSIKTIDFIPGGKSKDGITPVTRVRME